MRCVLFGVGSPYAFEVIESLERLGADILALVANVADEVAPCPPELGPVIRPAALTPEHLAEAAFVPLLTPGFRSRVVTECRALGFSKFATVVDPTARLPRRIELAQGVHINTGAVIGARSRLGFQVIVNRSASVGHDVVVEPYATLGPGCVVSGSVTIGRGAFLGAGAVVTPGCRVGANALVGAGAVVIADVPERSVVVGNPARVLRSGGGGYGGVTVEAAPDGG